MGNDRRGLVHSEFVMKRGDGRELLRAYPPLFTPENRKGHFNVSNTTRMQHHGPTLLSLSIDILTRSPFVMLSNLSLTTRKLSVEATTTAALEDSPEPAGTEPVTKRSIPTGRSFVSLKNRSRTPWRLLLSDVEQHEGRTHMVACFNVAFPTKLRSVDVQIPLLKMVLLGRRMFVEYICCR